MSIAFSSNHRDVVAGGQLLVEVATEDGERGVTLYDRLSFSLPPDFHAHNDTIATTLAAIAGPNYAAVRFNFPISAHAAAALGSAYRFRDIGPVDPALPPRSPGRFVGVSLSGGSDSLAVWLTLQEAGEPFKVVAGDYGGWLSAERGAFAHVPRDVTCAADFRTKPYGFRSPYGVAAVTLLFADYLDLGRIAVGVKAEEYPESLNDDGTGRLPWEGALAGAGLEQLHVIRSLMTPGVLRVVGGLRPELLQAALTAGADPGTAKYFRKAGLARLELELLGASVPSFLDAIPPPTSAEPFGSDLPQDLSALFIYKYLGPEAGRLLTPGIEQHDLRFLRRLSLDFMRKYNPNALGLLPLALQNGVRGTWHRLGIQPYARPDWKELAVVRDFLNRTRRPGPGW